MVVIIDYNIGNITSVQNMLKKVGCRDAVISSDPEVIAKATKLILPGVGHFDYGMRQLKASGVIDILNTQVLEKRIPILGICLGAQLLTRGSEEGEVEGLGWIDADTVKFDATKLQSGLKIPHMGWSDVTVNTDAPLLQNLPEDPRFYFVHTYHMECDHKENEVVTANYGYTFAAGISKGNIMGMQFHPEKSHKFGMQLFKNFVEHY
jgi:imidazole glycerol-phosphate synthase subunit HisH